MASFSALRLVVTAYSRRRGAPAARFTAPATHTRSTYLLKSLSGMGYQQLCQPNVDGPSTSRGIFAYTLECNLTLLVSELESPLTISVTFALVTLFSTHVI